MVEPGFISRVEHLVACITCIDLTGSCIHTDVCHVNAHNGLPEYAKIIMQCI